MFFERTTDCMNVKKEKSANWKWILVIVCLCSYLSNYNMISA